MSDKTEEFGQAPSEPHDEYGRAVCLQCGSKLGGDCGDAEPDFNAQFCSKGCFQKHHAKYFSFYVDEDGIKDDKLSLTSEGYEVVTYELENLVDVFFPDGEETIVPTDTANYPDEEITLSDIRTDLMRYLDNRANRES